MLAMVRAFDCATALPGGNASDFAELLVEGPADVRDGSVLDRSRGATWALRDVRISGRAGERNRKK